MAKTPKDTAQFYKANSLPSNFCPIPFSTLIFEANGTVCMCRQKGSDFVIGDIRTQTVEEIWNGNLLQDIREEFLTGNVSTCAREIARDHCNLAIDHLDFLKKVDFSKFQKNPPFRITPNFNGRCNLECPMCHIWQFPNGIYDSIDFWPELEKNILPHLCEIDTFSGEPFIQKDTYRLIQISSRINPAILWSFTTNGQWAFTETIRTHLDLVRIKNFNFSIDTLNPDTYTLIRRKGNLNRLLDTFLKIKEYKHHRNTKDQGPFILTMICIAQRLNVRDLPEIFSFRRQHEIKINLQCLVYPAELSLMTMNEPQVINDLEYLLEHLSSEDLITCNRVVAGLLESLSKIEKARYILLYKEKAGL